MTCFLQIVEYGVDMNVHFEDYPGNQYVLIQVADSAEAESMMEILVPKFIEGRFKVLFYEINDESGTTNVTKLMDTG